MLIRNIVPAKHQYVGIVIISMLAFSTKHRCASLTELLAWLSTLLFKNLLNDSTPMFFCSNATRCDPQIDNISVTSKMILFFFSFLL